MGVRVLVYSESGYGQVAGCCEHGHENSGPIKQGQFLNYAKNCDLFGVESALSGYLITVHHLAICI